MLYLNCCRDGSFLDTEPQADAAVTPVKVSEESERALTAALSLESYPLARALAEVFLAGAAAGERAVSAGRRSARGTADVAG
jgi:hypothetical protein